MEDKVEVDSAIVPVLVEDGVELPDSELREGNIVEEMSCIEEDMVEVAVALSVTPTVLLADSVTGSVNFWRSLCGGGTEMRMRFASHSSTARADTSRTPGSRV